MGLRRISARALVLAALSVLAVTGLAQARWDVFRAGNLILKFDGGVTPKVLPKDEMIPVGVYGKVRFETTDGTHMPAFRGGTFEVDRNVAFDAKGLPVCRRGALEASDSAAAKAACGDSIVGTGNGTVDIAFPESTPIRVESPITFFNGGVRNGTTMLFVHIYITVPVPTSVVTKVKFRKVGGGLYGTRIVSEVPVIAGGSGSVVAASFRLKRLFEYRGAERSYLKAKCPDGLFRFRVVEADIRDESAGPAAPSSGLALSGTISRPCTRGS